MLGTSADLMFSYGRFNTCFKEAADTSVKTDSLLLTGTKILSFILDQHKSCQAGRLLFAGSREKVTEDQQELP